MNDHASVYDTAVADVYRDDQHPYTFAAGRKRNVYTSRTTAAAPFHQQFGRGLTQTKRVGMKRGQRKLPLFDPDSSRFIQIYPCQPIQR
jgi:hypothetical protein